MADLESAGYIFFVGLFSSEILTWASHFLPLNCPERSEGKFRGQKNVPTKKI